MKITVRGWSRDMGTKVVADHNLAEISMSSDRSRSIGRDRPGIFTSFEGLFVAWFQQLRHIGDYRMQIEFSDEDVVRLFKARFGSELRPWLIDDDGFTVSPEFTKRVLRSVKLSDVTLGDLAAMSVSSPDQPATADKLVEDANVVTLRRLA